jgi:hypothetical protein
LHTRDELVLEKLQAFFGVGVINKYLNTVNYKVRKFEDICNVIIPHFSNFPLLTQKRADFELFKQGVLYLKDREFLSLSLDDIKYLTSLKASIGRGITGKLSETFPDIKAVDRPLVKNVKISDPN